MLKIAYEPGYEIPLPEGHRFPMAKYGLIPQQLLHEGTVEKENFFKPEFPDDEYILAVHTQEYYEDLIHLRLDRKAERKIGFPLSSELIRRERIIAGGTIMASEYAIQYGIGMNVSGGTHHAYSGHGEGFCMLNDQAIAAAYLLKKKLAKKILIVDLDVHQGNGTAEIFTNNDFVFTFSMHGEKNYPFKKEKSDLDIGLKDKTADEEYLNILRKTLPQLIENEKPDFIFYLSGVDILETDRLGRLSISPQGCKERDRFVFETCVQYEIPVACSMGGGYSPEIRHIVDAHANTFRVAREIYE